jgi:hypothetical protein
MPSQNVHEDAPSVTNDPAEQRPASRRRHRNPYQLGIDRGIMGDVIFITKERLERMLSEGERNLRLGLSRSKMQVIKIIGNGFVQRRKRGIYYEMMVAGIGFLNARRCYPHVDEAKAYGQPTRHVGSIGWVDEINLGIRSRGMSMGIVGCGGGVDDPNPDTLGHYRRRMLDMPAISQYKLKGMLPRAQVHFSLSLAHAKMQVIEVAWNRLIKRRQLGINYQMVVTSIRSLDSRWCYPHTAKSKMNSRLGRQRVAILKVDEINRGPRR